MTKNISLLRSVVSDLRTILPSKATFHETTRIQTLAKVEEFNKKTTCLTAGFYVHFEQVGESTEWKWTKITIGGKDGETVLSRVAGKGRYRIEKNFTALEPFIKPGKSNPGRQKSFLF